MNPNAIQHAGKCKWLHTRYWLWAALLIVILFTVAIRVRLLQVPLERDEGEYAYAAQLILQGVPPYAHVYTMKMPGVFLAYALILAAFGQTHAAIHLGLLIINVATILLLFLLAKRLFGPFTAAATAAAFALLSLGQPIQGVFANAEHFVILFAIGGILLLLRALDRQGCLSLLAAAVMLGLAFLMKQHGAAFVLFGVFYLFFCELRRRPLKWKTFAARVLLFLIGVSLPFILTCLFLWWFGVFEKFWFWTFSYAWQYVSALPLSAGLNRLKVRIIWIAGSAVFVWILAGLGLAYLFWNKKVRRHRLFVAGFLLFSFLAICPGLYFRPHYFVLLLPAVALLAGIGAGCAHNFFAQDQSSLAAQLKPILLVVIIFSHAVYQQYKFFFVVSPAMASRITYDLNPFPESLEIARFVREHSTEGDRIAVVGSEPQIYFYSGRRSATGYIYTYEMMRNHPYALKMQQEMIREIEAARPEFLLFVSVPTSWLVRPDSEKLIFEWFIQYRDQYYRKVGIIDIFSRQQTAYRWGSASDTYAPRSGNLVTVFQLSTYDPNSQSPSLESDDSGAYN